jgi:hypothetical protein
MDLKKAIKLLEKHQKWRVGDRRVKFIGRENLTTALDIAIIKLKEINGKASNN